MFDPVSLALTGASLAGGIFGRKRKHIDPEYLRQHFGAKAISDDTHDLANRILNSPYGQKLLANAAESGQNFQTSMAAKAAASGLDPSSGASAGAGDFATSAAAQAQNTFERGVRGDVYAQAMPIAERQNEALRNAYINDLQGGGYQDDKAGMWQAIGNAAGQARASIGPGMTQAAGASPQQAFDVASAAVGPAQQGAGRIIPAGASAAVAPQAAGTDANGMRGPMAAVPTADVNGSMGAIEPSQLTRRLNARRLGMSRAMIGQGAVRPYANG